MNLQRAKKILPSWKKIREIRKLAELGTLDSDDVKFFLGQGLVMIEGNLAQIEAEGETPPNRKKGEPEGEKVVQGFAAGADADD